MPITLDDLKPKPFKVKVRDLELTCKPPRLSHGLIAARAGEIFSDYAQHSAEDIKQAEADLDSMLADLIPELKGTNLNIDDINSLLAQIMDSMEPSDNKELKDKGVKVAPDLKAKETTG